MAKKRLDIKTLDVILMQGHVPQTCLLGGDDVMVLVGQGKDPCKGCNCPREKCHGRPMSHHWPPLGAGRMSKKALKQCAEWLEYCLKIGWSKEQLDGLEAIKEIEEEIINRGYIGYEEYLLSKIKELEDALFITTGALEGSQNVVKELEKGIEKHRDYNLQFWAFDDLTFEDRKLYKLLEKKK
jgi:hypothetical protein